MCFIFIITSPVKIDWSVDSFTLVKNVGFFSLYRLKNEQLTLITLDTNFKFKFI